MKPHWKVGVRRQPTIQLAKVRLLVSSQKLRHRRFSFERGRSRPRGPDFIEPAKRTMTASKVTGAARAWKSRRSTCRPVPCRDASLQQIWPSCRVKTCERDECRGRVHPGTRSIKGKIQGLRACQRIRARSARCFQDSSPSRERSCWPAGPLRISFAIPAYPVVLDDQHGVVLPSNEANPISPTARDS